METVEIKHIRRRMEEYQSDMEAAAKRLQGIESNMMDGFVGSAVQESMRYHEAKAKLKALQDVIDLQEMFDEMKQQNNI